MSRVVAFSWGLGIVVATALPALRSPQADAFPFSTYPMFATPREKPELLVAEGVTASENVGLPAGVVGSGSVMQAIATLYQAQAQGPEGLRQLCEAIAGRVARSAAHTNVRRVQIVSARFDPIAYFERGPEPERREVLQRCRVPRTR